MFRGIHTGKEGRVVNYNPGAGSELAIEVDGSVSEYPIYVKKTMAELAPTAVAIAI